MTTVLIDRPVTSIAAEINKFVTISSIVEELTTLFINFYIEFSKEGFSSFATKIRRHMEFGKTIRFHHGNTVLEGVIEHFNNNGSLTLTLPDGTQQSFLSGEIGVVQIG